jgi:1,2-phenylacetyl-CoA epoxidase PaaB subunit
MSLVKRGGEDELEAEIAALEAAARGEGGDPVSRQESNVPDVPPTDPVKSENPPLPATDNQPEEGWKKRYGDLRKHSQKKEQELKDEIERLKQSKQSAPDLANEEDVVRWMENNPKATAVIKRIVGTETTSKTSDFEKQLTELNRDKSLQKILKAHPDFDDVVSSVEFLDWADTQPAFIQDKIYENENADDVIWALNVYKELNKKGDPNKAAAGHIRTNRTAAPAGEEGTTFSESQVASNSLEWYEKNRDAIESAIRSGKFNYDISGAAR